MKEIWDSIVHSRKARATVAGILVILTLLATGQMEAETAAKLITGLITVYVAGVTGEDMAAKNSGGKATVSLPAATSTGTTSTQATITTVNTPAEMESGGPVS